MGLTYFKRFRMEIDLAGRRVPVPVAPPGYRFLPWHDSLLDAHAEVKFLSFHEEIDAAVFPCFNDLAGCRRLMGEISRKKGFLADATWLAVSVDPTGAVLENCGTIQGIRDRRGVGAVQNVGIVPEHRGRSLGTRLLLLALGAFQRQNLHRVYLEVTADNEAAVKLYRRMGFRVVKTVYKSVEVACT